MELLFEAIAKASGPNTVVTAQIMHNAGCPCSEERESLETCTCAHVSVVVIDVTAAHDQAQMN